MNHRFIVAIQDNNRFFAQGVEHLLRDYFTRHGREVQFVRAPYSEIVDLLILTESGRGALPPCRLMDVPWRDGQTAIITIREPQHRPGISMSPCRSRRGVIGRRDKISTVTHLIDRALEWRADGAFFQARCERCTRTLTPREFEVLRCIHYELEPARVCRLLHLSPKTLSSHKRTAMRKLGFQRNHELYRWLRQGGLDFEKRVKS
ncbi:Bacterial regulatory proteins, luxR family [Serratia entomophila]|uniref:Response regulator transcription factor n=1 Tax=Serratia entomophila TaxID=42906 RepID=A0ABY5CVJ5_9GAMM|nr:LuxR C-terminal-related transcriptional regulator [Serratia entomophila]UIW18847.1 LuxR C-terminal-related transcriptional regulator [Serratia entomophila]USV01506.1 response regulator transcription factor [Serratia entomophila]CAI0774765.1 Bacterial regulatory proteins, luxR family [Serratia entomophila]CAI0776789.1 Bacterial regulatory proteins, luxR family [Serratia entomophila]CAI0797886.1 Bacterial regulatory proteins, luxR family [Serratia entomophila]